MKKVLLVICILYISDLVAVETVQNSISKEYSIKEKFGETELILEGYTETKHDHQGNKVEETEYSSYGNIKFKYLYKYDDQGNKIETYSYNSEGNPLTKSIREYDDQGNQKEFHTYDLEGNLLTKSIIEYDDQGNERASLTHNTDGIIIGWIYIHNYDDQGNEIEKAKYEPKEQFGEIQEKIISKTVTTYTYYE